jgi:small subunit ribosomal protein S20
MRTSLEEQFRNRAVRTTVKGAIKDLRACTSQQDALAQYKITVSKVDKAVQKNIYHKNKAARLKSRLAGFVQSLGENQ